MNARRSYELDQRATDGVWALVRMGAYRFHANKYLRR